MIKELYLKYQKDLKSDENFLKLAEFLKPKILYIYNTIDCHNQYKEEFIQDCHYKILDVAGKKYFDESSNDKVIGNYFTKVFMSVKRQFIKNYELYRNNIQLDVIDKDGIPLIDRIPDYSYQEDDATTKRMRRIERSISSKDFAFLMMFIDSDSDRLRSITEVAKLLCVTCAAVSMRFKRIKEALQKIEDFIFNDEEYE